MNMGIGNKKGNAAGSVLTQAKTDDGNSEFKNSIRNKDTLWGIT